MSTATALDRDPRVLAGYALVQLAVVSFSYLAVTSLGFGRRGFMHLALPWYLVVPGAWLVVFGLSLAAIAGRTTPTT